MQSVADLAVVIVNYRTPEDVERALASVQATAGDLRLELVVVDNASGDGSPDLIEAAVPGVRVVRNDENRGFAAGVNAGFRATAAPLVLVLNPDTIVEPGALAALVEHLRAHAQVGAAAPLLVHEDGSPQPNGYRRFPNLATLFADFCVPLSYALGAVPAVHPHNLPWSSLTGGARVAHAYGAALAVRRAAYDAAGPFDERFFLYLEETEFQERVGRAGWAIDIVPAARIVHLVRGGGEAAEIPSVRYLESAYLWFEMHGVPAWRVDVTLAVALALSQVALLAIGLIPGKRAQSARRRRGYAELSRWVRARRRSS